MENLNLKNMIDKTIVLKDIPGIVVSDPLPEFVGKYRFAHETTMRGKWDARFLAFNYEDDGIEMTALRVLIAPVADRTWFSIGENTSDPSGVGTWYYPQIFSSTTTEIGVETAKVFVGNGKNWNEWGKDEMGCFHTGGDGSCGVVSTFKRKKGVGDAVRFEQLEAIYKIPGTKTGIVAVSIELDFDADMVSPEEAVQTAMAAFDCRQ